MARVRRTTKTASFLGDSLRGAKQWATDKAMKYVDGVNKYAPKAKSPVRVAVGSIGIIGTTAFALAKGIQTIRRDMTRKRLIEELGRTDPVLSRVEPEQLMEWYAAIYHLAPTISLDKSSVREILQNFARFGRVDVNTLKMLADTEKSVSDAKAKSYPWGNVLSNLATSASLIGG